MAKITERLELSEFGLAPELSARLNNFVGGLLRPIQPDEFTVGDLIRENRITDAQARQIIKAGVRDGKLEKVERLRYREGQKPLAGNIMAYKFVEGENAKAQPDKKKSVRQAHRRTR